MAVDPEFTEALAALPPMQFADPAAQRAATATLLAALPPRPLPAGVVRTEEVHAGVPVCRYTADADGPVLLWLHGGGYCIGSVAEDQPLCARLAAELGGVVVAPEYRLAPEHPYPAAVDDCLAVARRLDRPIIGGASAGAGLAAAVALRARDDGGPPVRAQLLLFPFLDARPAAAAAVAGPEAFSAADARQCWEHYLAGLADVPAAASPALAADLRGLPPAYVLVAGADCLHDQGVAYALALRRAGVRTELHSVPGAPHGFTAVAPRAGVSRRAMAEVYDVLRRFGEV